MYSTVGILRNAKKSGRLTGTHQKLDRIARAELAKITPKTTFFPSIKQILHFEGNRGPDGLKWKSPGVDEPMHFIMPDHDDGKLFKIISDHHYNLKKALKQQNAERAAFESAWLAHAITDGLTPAHHFPYEEAVHDLMSDKEYVKIFGHPVKGIMRGQNLAEATKNNLLYWGPEGYMTKHISFEYNVAVIATSASKRVLTPRISDRDLERADLKADFYDSLAHVARLRMYKRFAKQGWTLELASETRQILLPEIVRAIILAWYTAIPKEQRHD